LISGDASSVIKTYLEPIGVGKVGVDTDLDTYLNTDLDTYLNTDLDTNGVVIRYASSCRTITDMVPHYDQDDRKRK
jgi:hypothetical protein